MAEMKALFVIDDEIEALVEAVTYKHDVAKQCDPRYGAAVWEPLLRKLNDLKPRDDKQDVGPEDSELQIELFTVLENHDVPEGLRETIIDMVTRWEMEKD